MKEKITESSGNVFVDLGFSPEESALLSMRAKLMAKLREAIIQNGWTQVEAASVFRISQSRVSDLVRGKYEKFSLDMLISLNTRAGKKVSLEIA